MANILTLTEAANVLRCEETDPTLADLLPDVDAYITLATDRDWSLDNPIRPEAKSVARMLLVREHEDPGGLAAGGALSLSLNAKILQLQILARMMDFGAVPEDALTLVASRPVDRQTEVAITVQPVLIFSNPLEEDEYTKITLKMGNVPVTITTAEDATRKILGLYPSAPLAAGTEYRIVIAGAADIYGQTLTTEIGFRTL